MTDEKICGIPKSEYLDEGVALIEGLREEIEGKLGEIEFMINDMAQNLPELEATKARAEAYWLPTIKGCLREEGSRVIMSSLDETLDDIRKANVEQED